MVISTTTTNVVVGHVIGPLMKTPTNVSMFMYSATVWLLHRIHYDGKFAMEHEALPDVVVHGTLATDWLAQLLLTWGGADARLARLSYQIRSYMLPDQMVSCGGVVTAVRQDGRDHQIDLDVWIRKPDGVQAVTGSATLVLQRVMRK
jgi:hydroxyacyl-ACP dehydratase HTD2-like protein with hotdog domain